MGGAVAARAESTWWEGAVRTVAIDQPILEGLVFYQLVHSS